MILEKTAVHWRYNKDAKRYTIPEVPIPEVPIPESQSQRSQSQMPGSQAPHTSNPKPGTMKAAVYKENGIITLEHRPVPALADPQDAIIRVTLTTICSSDIHIKHGAVPRLCREPYWDMSLWA